MPAKEEEQNVRPMSAVEVTRLLSAWRSGDASALEKLTPVVYGELHRLARKYMAGERDGHVLQASALVNEAYVRLMRDEDANLEWADRGQFFAFSAQLMRRILVDFARAQQADKRGGDARHVPLDRVLESVEGASPERFLDLNDALDRLAESDPRVAHVVELKFFGGLSEPEIAKVLDISHSSVSRDWRFGRAWLFKALESGRD